MDTEQVALVPGVVDHVPLLQVDETATDEHVAGDVTDDAVYELHEAPLAVRGHAPEAAQPAEQEAFARGVSLHDPFEQVEVRATDSHVPVGVADEYVVQVTPFAAVAQTPDAAQPEVHEAFANGSSLHVPPLHVETRSTDEQLFVGDASEYVVHVPPSAVSAQAPTGAQTVVQVALA